MSKFFVAALLVAAAHAGWVQMEADATVGARHAEWLLKGAAEADAPQHVIFVFKHEPARRDALEKYFWEVSDPQHPSYTKYLTFDQITEYLSAKPADIDLVLNYLRSFGLNEKNWELNGHKDMLTVHTTIGVLESMLNTKFGVYSRTKDGVSLNRVTAPYYLPYELAQVISLVGEIVRLPQWTAPRRVNAPEINGQWPDYCGSKCTGKITPKVIQLQYNATYSSPINAKNTMAVAEFQTQYFDQTDVDTFTDACNLPRNTIKDRNGGNKASDCSLGLCVEALLDLEYMAGVGGSFPLYDYHLSQYSLLDWVNQVLADQGTTQVHSVSYGNDEIQQTSTAYMYSCNDQFMAAGAYGISILFASGDQGVWGRSGHNGHFNPDFPAASPYITAVGGTDFTTNNIGTETCCKDSGGGFSVTFARPSYQDNAVSNYLTKNAASLPPAAYYNSSGRAYPDISAEFGLNIPYCIVEASKYVGVAGTSASCPVVASFIANINNARLNAGKATLGFLNPFIYQTLANNPSAFTDITTGTNNGGTGDGFTAAAGWDPCSGVGTVNYGNLVAVALAA